MNASLAQAKADEIVTRIDLLINVEFYKYESIDKVHEKLDRLYKQVYAKAKYLPLREQNYVI